MSYVWSVMLSFHDEELWEEGVDSSEVCEPMKQINSWIPDGRLVRLIGPTYEDNCGFGMDANLYGGGFLHFDIEGFIEVVKSQRWKVRSKVQLWIKGGKEGIGTDPFTLIKLGRAKGRSRDA